MKRQVNGSHQVSMNILGDQKEDLKQSLLLELWIKHQGVNVLFMTCSLSMPQSRLSLSQ